MDADAIQDLLKDGKAEEAKEALSAALAEGVAGEEGAGLAALADTYLAAVTGAQEEQIATLTQQLDLLDEMDAELQEGEDAEKVSDVRSRLGLGGKEG